MPYQSKIKTSLLIISIFTMLVMPSLSQAGNEIGENTYYGENALNYSPYNTGTFNSAFGFQALYSNTTGNGNTANGYKSLMSNTEGYQNTAVGHYSLSENVSGNDNTGIGMYALGHNSTGYSNTAIGANALIRNTEGDMNTGVGLYALNSNTTGNQNTGNGISVLAYNKTGNRNTAYGSYALHTATGSNNIAVGAFAGGNLASGSNNISIGNAGVAGESNIIRLGTLTPTSIGSVADGIIYPHEATYIAGIYGVDAGSNQPVCINSDGQLGTVGCVGAIGSKGDKGDTGAPGLNGADGKNGADGLPGAKGADGLPGKNGRGVPVGGKAGQVLAKINGSDFNTQWITPSIGEVDRANTKNGVNALFSITSGNFNTAIGSSALYTATSGSNNIALGNQAGISVTTGSFNIDIGNKGLANDKNTIRIGGQEHKAAYISAIYPTNLTGTSVRNVVVNSTGKLGYSTEASEKIAALEATVAAQAKDIALLKAKLGL